MNATVLSISVIIPLDNGARFLKDALDSVFAQSVPPHEVIVVNDGSTDAGSAILGCHAAHDKIVILHQENTGKASARNLGIAHSSGRLIAFLDQDDTWHPHHLRDLLMPFADRQEEAPGWAYSDFDEIGEDGGLLVRSALSAGYVQHPQTDLATCLGEDISILPSTSLISRAAFDAVGGFDERLCGYEDDDLFIRLFVAGYRTVYVDAPLARCRMHAARSAYCPRMATSRMLYARKLLAAFPDEPGFSRFFARDLIAPRFLRAVVQETRLALRDGNLAAAESCRTDIAFLESHISLVEKPYPLRQDLLITAIIPLFNGGRFIREAIQSVLDQTLPPDEIIIVDDGSTDDGPEVVRQMARSHPIRLMTKTNGGQSSARNLGVDHAHGDLIAFLDQDDVWYPNHLSTLIEPFQEERAVALGWTYSGIDLITEAGDLMMRDYYGPSHISHPKKYLSLCLRHDMFILPSASLVSRKAFMSVGGFDERLSGYEDDDLFLRLFRAGFDNIYFSESLSKWRIFQASSSYSPRMAISRAIYARMLIERFPNDPDTDSYYVRDLIAPRFFRLMATEMRKATLKGSRQQQKAALANLAYITGHLRTIQRVPLNLLFLPALRVPALARLIMHYRVPLFAIARRFF